MGSIVVIAKGPASYWFAVVGMLSQYATSPPFPRVEVDVTTVVSSEVLAALVVVFGGPVRVLYAHI